MDISTPVTRPPDLYGRPRSDSFMQKLAAFSDNAVTGLARRSTPPRRPPATEMPVIRELVVATKHQEAEDVVSLRLAAPDGEYSRPGSPAPTSNCTCPPAASGSTLCAATLPTGTGTESRCAASPTAEAVQPRYTTPSERV